MTDGAAPPGPEAPSPAPPQYGEPSAPPRVSETDPLLPSRQRGRPATWRDLAKAFLLIGLVFAIPLSIIYTSHRQGYPPWRRTYPPVPVRRLPPISHPGPLNFTKRELRVFDFETPFDIAASAISILESFHSCGSEWSIAGHVRLASGPFDPYGYYNLEMSVAASSQSALDSVVWYQSDKVFHHAVEIRCDDNARKIADAAVQINVTVVVQPHIRYGCIRVYTDTLDIELAQGLAIDGGQIYLDSFNGSIVSYATSPDVKSSETFVYSGVGSISGIWFPIYKLDLSAGAPGDTSMNGATQIDVEIAPTSFADYREFGPVEARTSGGDIRLRSMPVENHTRTITAAPISVHSESGSIMGNFTIGKDITLTTGGNGSILAILLPSYDYGRETTHINTATQAGSTIVEVLSPFIDDHIAIRSLEKMESLHSSANGSLRITYPPEWEGTAVGLSKYGNVSISGPDLDIALAGEHAAVARKGKSRGNRLDFDTVAGDAELFVRGSTNKSATLKLSSLARSTRQRRGSFR